MVIGLMGLALNVPCNYVLIYGKFGLPQMGAVGCGVASSVSYWFMPRAAFQREFALVGKGDDFGVGHAVILKRMQRASKRCEAIGTMEAALNALKPDEPAFIFITARAEGPQMDVVGPEPVKPVAAKEVAGHIHRFFEGLQPVLQQGYFIVQGDAARLHFHEQGNTPWRRCS